MLVASLRSEGGGPGYVHVGEHERQPGMGSRKHSGGQGDGRLIGGRGGIVVGGGG